MSLVYDHNFEEENRKNQDFMDPYFPNQQQDQLIHAHGSARYRSATSNFLDNNGGAIDEDYRSFRSPSPEMDSFFAEVMKEEEEQEPTMHRNSTVDGSELSCHEIGLQNSGSSMSGSFGGMNNAGLAPVKPGFSNNATGSGIVKQHSSPPGLLSNLMTENEFNFTRDYRNLGNSNGVHSEAKRVSNHLNLEYSPAATLSNSNTVSRGSETRMNFGNDSWNTASFNVLKGSGETNITFSGSETDQNGSYRNRLVHHSSLPTTFSERNTVEKFPHFLGGAVPCKVRAKRGFATHPRSIAERVRRNRISERMKKLQDLFPDMDKQMSTADMLDLAVDHIKELQKHVKALNDRRANCRCSGKAKQN